MKEEFILNDETGRIIGIGIEIHKVLGSGFLEIVYKDASSLNSYLSIYFLKEKRISNQL